MSRVIIQIHITSRNVKCKIQEFYNYLLYYLVYVIIEIDIHVVIERC
jgi:hypothetical protein